MTNETGLTFDAESHTYRRNGTRVPSVTQILDSLSMRPVSFYPETPFYRQRGTAVHRATELVDKGSLDREKTGSLVMSFVRSYEQFLADFRPQVIGCERLVFCESFWYAGMMDRLYGWRDGTEAVVDIKTSANRNQAPPRSTGLQTAGYAYAAGIPGARRFALTLSPEGYRLWPEYTDRQDVETWLCCARVYHYKNPRR